MTLLYLHDFNRIAGLTPLQLAQRLSGNMRDEALVEEICLLARSSPAAMRALNWAALNDIRMTVGATPSGVLGSYCAATRRIVLGAGLRRGAVGVSALGTLVHEIRHAWQDAHGLLPHLRAGDFQYGRLEYLLAQNALCEADAHAYGMAAAREAEHGAPCAAPVMRDFFDDWFSSRAQRYGDLLRRQHALNLAASEYDVPHPATGIDPFCHEDRLRLGRDFCGNANYLAGISRDRFVRFYVAPEHVLRDYGAVPSTAAAVQIRKRQMSNRAALAPGRRRSAG